ncbi:hypothetical protein C8P68_1156 [Mucilaginibacter yixingensis]|uniref:Uncharacterized protein n=1 Tax=Mucilaginibacter yixingensis TaxID=1295612 RepID=A0A2T5J4L2_9SPHI|nr:hypothetical protein [Mucilaginibacter yixingensis]PTQ92010.1 hypothetical protein C8P68_1156 [Mucilaginibacter yixingensis]
MITEHAIILSLKEGTPFTSFRFYNEFLKELSQYYRTAANKYDPPDIVLDNDLVIEPNTLPLLITLGAYLKDFHQKRARLIFENDLVSNHLIKFLQRSDFLYIIGNNMNPTFPLGRRIFQFDERQVGDFRSKKEQRADHKVRIYSLDDSAMASVVDSKCSEEAQRDDLIEYFSFSVTKHFEELISDADTDNRTRRNVINTMAELITNGLFHSKSDAYVMMFSGRFKLSCSIADKGIGLYPTIADKPPTSYYEPLGVFKELEGRVRLKMSAEVQKCAFSIFETFYFSMLKNRRGLFDLMINIVVSCKGYFRLHYDSVQIIVSSRMSRELTELQEIRIAIANTHSQAGFGEIAEDEFLERMTMLSQKARQAILQLALTVFQRYTEDVQYSSIRIFSIKLPGVHIETEIPKIAN